MPITEIHIVRAATVRVFVVPLYVGPTLKLLVAMQAEERYTHDIDLAACWHMLQVAREVEADGSDGSDGCTSDISDLVS